MSLADDQALMWRAIRWPTGVADFLAQADEATRTWFARAFTETDAFDRVARVGVYAEAYYWRLHGVLADHFGLVAWLLGPSRFRNVVTDYVLACPSIDPDIRRYGARFPGFLATHALSAGVADVAAIEWSMVQALDAPDERVLTVDDLRPVPLDAFGAIGLRAVATARLHACALPFSALWSMHGSTPSPTTPPDIRDPAVDVLVWRAGLDPMHRELDADEAAALALVLPGTTFGALCDRTGAPSTVATWLHRWLADELLAANE
jgi:hypothetical protein